MTSIRKANFLDSIQVATIARETFYDTWRPVNTEEDMQHYMSKAFAQETIDEDLKNEQNTFLLALADNRVVGYAKIRRDRSHDEFRGEKAMEIERIYVIRAYQGMKIGKAMMDECITIATREKNEWLWLGVNVDNNQAIDFYKRYGFVIFGKKQFRLGDAVDDDYLMKKNLKEPE